MMENKKNRFEDRPKWWYKGITVKKARHFAQHLTENQIKALCRSGLIKCGKCNGQWIIETGSFSTFIKNLPEQQRLDFDFVD